MHCKFCQKRVKNVERHLCGKKYSYENIFKQILINILLDKEPVNVEDFFRCCVNFIKEKKQFIIKIKHLIQKQSYSSINIFKHSHIILNGFSTSWKSFFSLIKLTQHLKKSSTFTGSLSKRMLIKICLNMFS